MVYFSFFLLRCQLPVTFHFPSSNYCLLQKKIQLYETPSCLCSYKMIIQYSLNSLPITIPKGHCRLYESRVNPVSSTLTYLLTTDLKFFFLLTPASLKRSLSLGSHIKSTLHSFSKIAFGKYLIFEMCHVSSQCASTDCLQIRLATVSHVSARADNPLLGLFCIVSGYPTFTAVLFLLRLQGRVSCIFFHLISIIIIIIIIIFIACAEYIQLYT